MVGLWHWVSHISNVGLPPGASGAFSLAQQPHLVAKNSLMRSRVQSSKRPQIYPPVVTVTGCELEAVVHLV